METQALRRNLFQRLFGICATRKPADPGAWGVQAGRVTVDLDRLPELADPDQSIRLEKGGLPDRLLVVHGNDGRYHAFRNRCRHAGRRLDPIPGTTQVQCCSVGRSTYDYTGKVLSGPARGPLEVLPVRREGNRLLIELQPPCKRKGKGLDER